MNRSRTRSSTVVLAALSVAAVAALTGCSAGQIAQTAGQEPAINGTGAWVGDSTTGVALRNVHLRVTQTSDYVRPGDDVELLFVAVNESADQADRLVSITSEVGNVAVTGDAQLPASGTLVVGTPDGQPSPLDATEGANTVEAKVALSAPISNGLTYPFTFTFQRSGETTIQVPISAGETPRREAEASGAEGAEGGAESDTGAHG